jgi:RHS repeat-associated protein
VLGEYGASAADVKAEFIWALPQAGSTSTFGGDDGIGGYAPLVVGTPDSGGTIQLNWVHANHLGVPLVTTDAAGAPAATPNDYLAPGFPGQSRTLADLYYNRYRDYDPTTGRYIQADPIGLDGGSNPYLYAGANPVNWADPLGLEKAIFFSPSADTSFWRGAMSEPDIPGVCLIYGHMSPDGIVVWRNGKRRFLRDPIEIQRESVKLGCKPRQPVYFLGCRAGRGDNPIAQKYAIALGVPVTASTNYTWWAEGVSRSGVPFYGYQGTAGKGKDGKMNTNDPGVWRTFKP